MPYNQHPQRGYQQQRSRQGGQGQYGRGSRPAKPGHIAGTLYEGNGICLWRGSIEVAKLHESIDRAEQDSTRPGVVSARCNQSKYDGNAFLSFHGVGSFNGGENGGQDRTYRQERYNRDHPDPRYRSKQYDQGEYDDELEELEEEEQEDEELEADSLPERTRTTRNPDADEEEAKKKHVPKPTKASSGRLAEKKARPTKVTAPKRGGTSKSHKEVAWEE